MRPEIAIVGVGMSARSKCSGTTPLHMAVDAGRAALADAGLRPGDVDAVMSYHDNDSAPSHLVATHLGIRTVHHKDVIGGGGATEMLVADAAGLIAIGLVRTVLIYRSMNGRSGLRMGGGGHRAGAFLDPYGLVTPAQRFAMVAMRHMHETGTTEEHLASVCLTFYDHAQRNPGAMLYGKPLTRERYFATPYVCSPFRLHDCSLETDEANAIVVTSVERAADLRRHPVRVDAVVSRNSAPHAHQFANDDITDVGARYAGDQLFAMASVTRADVDVAAVYDCFSWVVLAQLEAYGFVGRGEAGPFAADGNLRLAGGSLPANTAGGMLSEGYTHGMNNVIELVRQLRHEYEGTDRQVAGCEVGISTGWGGPQTASAMLVTRT